MPSPPLPALPDRGTPNQEDGNASGCCQKRIHQEVLPVALVSMSAEAVSQHIMFCADRLLCELKQPKMCNVENLFPWMVLVSLQGKTNFFEKKVGECTKSGVASKHHHEFDLEADF